MEQGLLDLLKLQDVDKELQSLKDAKSEYPAEIAAREREITRAEDALKKYTDGLEKASKKQRQLERQLDDAKNTLKEQEARFAEVTNNREYDALQLEIEASRSRIADCETHILEVLDMAETLRQQADEQQASLDQVRDTQEARISELREKLSTLEEEVSKVSARRQRFARSIDEALLRQYEHSRKQPGTRVAPVRKGACGGCYRQLPAQHRSNVRRNDHVFLCENCGRILVWDDESS